MRRHPLCARCGIAMYAQNHSRPQFDMCADCRSVLRLLEQEAS